MKSFLQQALQRSDDTGYSPVWSTVAWRIKKYKLEAPNGAQVILYTDECEWVSVPDVPFTASVSTTGTTPVDLQVLAF